MADDRSAVAAPGRPLEVVVVTSPGCHLCTDAERVLRAAAASRPMDLRCVDIDSPEGVALQRRHRPALQPLVLVDGERFSVGRLSRGRLRRLLAERAHG